MADKNIDKEALKAQKDAEKAAKKAKQERIKQSKPKKEGNIATRGVAAVKKFCKDFVGTCKKVAWPTGKQVIKNSGVVLAAIAIVTLAVAAVDWGLSTVFNAAEKGVEELAEAAKLLPEYTFMVAGDGADKDMLKDIENVKLVGFLSGDKLTQFMGQAKVLLVPSIWYENCPLSILEAQCMGVPVATVNNGGMAELVKDGITGILIDDPAPEKIALKLRQILENKEYYETLKENCKKEKENILSVETYCDILIKEYEKLVAR
jgi:preprotein translocase SecE subunit